MRRRPIAGVFVLAVVVSMMSAAMAGNVAAEKAEGASQGGRPLSTALTGAAEVPGPGDPDGSGSALVTLNVGQRQVCWEISVADIAEPTAAHIHKGAPDVAGPVVVPLLTSAGGGLVGCIGVDRSLVKDILQNPDAYYVNVHNADFPSGAVRGQLG